MGGHEMKFEGIRIGLVMLFVLLSPLPLCAEEYTLEDLYRLALERSEKIKLSEENLVIAEIGKDKAMSVLFPRLSAFGNYTRFSEDKYNELNYLIQPDSAGQWGFRLDQQFSLSLREFTALSYSKQNIVKSREDLATTREEYLFQVAQAYYDVLRLKKALDIANANLERVAKYRDMAERRLKLGEVTKTVLLRADGELSGAKSDKLRTENGLAMSKAVLARIVGLQGDYSLKEHTAGEDQTLSLIELQDRAYAERSDLKALADQKKMAAQQVTYARGAFWPNVALTGMYQKADQDPASTTLNEESIYGGVGVSFPFFEGGLRKAELNEAKARERQAGYQYEDLKKTIGMEVENAYLEMITQKGNLTYLNDQLIFARDNYNAVSRQFEVGLANSIDVLDANTLLVTAERQLAQSTYTYQMSLLRIKKVTGILLREFVTTGKQG